MSQTLNKKDSVISKEKYIVRDIELAEFGRKEIEIAEKEMPGLVATRKKYGKEKPLAGARVMGSLHSGANRDSGGIGSGCTVGFL